jgi:arabinose-5-phosphate isomerase
MILATKGRIIISGMGKSGIIGKKIAATLSSTGTPSFTVHPGEAYHGDLGMITVDDTVMLISHSGETEEVIRLIPSIRRFGAPIIALVGNLYSTLARNADVVLDVSVEREAYPYIQFPTSSSTVTLVMGDALAVALVERRKFRPQDFALLHPAGSANNFFSERPKSKSAFQEMGSSPLKSSVPG